ncbi:hypothetical protein HF521_002886 [Silurus meridionalis]|uniref:Uncharacterized protein n=1 Tax=Silurus meridionalis TaxID=175797 RepID=A0A8T0B2F2_SILME|nr:hypothetical protein HF521_002886 [Silurus meridionalis]
MADRVRKGLVWDIRKSLLNLSSVELFQVAKSIGPIPGKDFSELDVEDQEGCLEYINAFMYSTHLLESEDRDKMAGGVSEPMMGMNYKIMPTFYAALTKGLNITCLQN